jgi:hypothetical protein
MKQTTGPSSAQSQHDPDLRLLLPCPERTGGKGRVNAALLHKTDPREAEFRTNVFLAADSDDQATPFATQIDRTADESSDACFRAVSRPSPGGAGRHAAPKPPLGRSAALGLMLPQARIMVGPLSR